MCKKDVIFFSIVFLWILMIICEVIFGVIKEYGEFLNLIPIVILSLLIIPRIYLKKYNNWLESDLKVIKPVPTLKEIRLKKLKKINRYEF